MHVAPDKRPLDWPDDLPRTSPHRRQQYRGYWASNDFRILHSRYVTAVGDLSLSWSQLSYSGNNGEPGVALRYELHRGLYVLCSDSYAHWLDNLEHILTRMRMCRWSSYSLVNISHALPARPSLPEWCKHYGFEEIPSREALEKAHRKMVFDHHPDRGGSTEAMKKLNALIEEARSFMDKGA